MNVKEYLKDHPVASVFLAWTGADIVRMGINLITDIAHCHHIERVNKQRMSIGERWDQLTYGCETKEYKKETTTESKDEQTEEGS